MKEYSKVLKLVEEKKKKFRTSGIDKLILNFYFREIGLLDENKKINKDNREIVFSLVDVVIDSGHVKNIDGEQVDEFRFDKNAYRVAFDGHNLKLLFNEKLVLHVLVDVSKNTYEWEIYEIETFVEDTWIDGLRRLQELIESKRPNLLKRRREKELLEQKKEIVRLKENFGIE